MLQCRNENCVMRQIDHRTRPERGDDLALANLAVCFRRTVIGHAISSATSEPSRARTKRFPDFQRFTTEVSLSRWTESRYWKAGTIASNWQFKTTVSVKFP